MPPLLLHVAQQLDAERAGGLAVDREGKTAYLVADGRLTTIAIADGKVKPVALESNTTLAVIAMPAITERGPPGYSTWKHSSEEQSCYSMKLTLLPTRFYAFNPSLKVKVCS